MKSLLILLCAVSLVACDDELRYDGDPDIIGTVIEFTDDRALVDIESGELTEYGYGDDIALSYDDVEGFSRLQQGEEIAVWLTGQVLDSNPPKAGIGRYERVESE
ncbi:hypothetical protein ABID56_001374 [Alkalibacillus flavidus]|uniref:DUF3221 domain-containing protein n=1 Tax=Alkalibacillus flavidus TaxID=546021 RepID=A0ABV2KUM3_9BACI